MKKVVLKLELDDDRAKQKALKTVTTLPGIDSISVDMKGKRMTVSGKVDPMRVVTKLRKHWEAADIISLGPAKDPPGKKQEQKKEEPKKGGAKEAPKKGGETMMKSEDVRRFPVAYHPPPMLTYYHAPSIEDNPNACVIS